jgi:hypothetical protein
VAPSGAGAASYATGGATLIQRGNDRLDDASDVFVDRLNAESQNSKFPVSSAGV